MSVTSWCCTCFFVVLCVSFCTGHFVMVPLNFTHLHCLQHSLFEHLFNLYIQLDNFHIHVERRFLCQILNTKFDLEQYRFKIPVPVNDIWCTFVREKGQGQLSKCVGDANHSYMYHTSHKTKKILSAEWLK